MKLTRRHWPVLVLIAVIIVLALPTLTYPLGRDQGEFATIGRGLLQGRVPYRDLWNPKPPAVFYLYAGAMSLFGQSTTALRALDHLLVPGMLLGLYWIGVRLFSRWVGFWAVLLFGVFYFTETFWTLTQNDGLVLLPMILALACVIESGYRSPRTASLLLFIAGALAGIVFWFKYPFVLFIALLGVIIWLRTTHNRLPIISYSLSALFGLLTTGLGFAVYLLALGAMPDLIESARVTSQYTSLTFNWAEFSTLLTTALGFRWSHWGLLFVLAGIGFAQATSYRLPGISHQLSASSPIPNHQPPATSHGSLIPPLWLLTSLAIMLIQAKAYDYHWLPMLPPMALLGGVGIEGIQKIIGGRDKPRPYIGTNEAPQGLSLVAGLVPTAWLLKGVVGVGLLAILVINLWGRAWPYITGQVDQRMYYQGFQAGEFVASESLEVAEYLRARVAPGDSLTIWGFRPEIYYLSGLNPATRFIFQFPLVGSWYPAAWQQEHVDGLWAAMPPYVIVAQVDYMPWVTGIHEDSNTLLQRYTELNNWLIANYERDAQIGNLFLWKRKS
ncbi:MAG TPA: glycosyltransferase family 39 protein [Aggregatilineales bacterium]|nr:glycosyltransferase family 39 protein [Aggregatilineales bacterium]